MVKHGWLITKVFDDDDARSVGVFGPSATDLTYRPHGRGWLARLTDAAPGLLVSPTRAWVACSSTATVAPGTCIAHTGVGGLAVDVFAEGGVPYRPHGRGWLVSPLVCRPVCRCACPDYNLSPGVTTHRAKKLAEWVDNLPGAVVSLRELKPHSRQSRVERSRYGG